MTARAEVLLPGRLAHGFDYAVPEGMILSTGDYVRVPFGGREAMGVVWGPGSDARADGKLKTIAARLDHLPPMTDALREFVRFAAWYTCAPPGMALKMCLPVADALEPSTARERKPLIMEQSTPHPPALSQDQQAAADALAAKLNAGFSVTLLDGITGSGKTEVYFDAIDKVLGAWCLVPGEEDTNKPPGTNYQAQTLVLLPEISLSVQWLERFTRRFGVAPLVWHSGLTPAARKHAWRAIVHGEARVIVGARSALFLPYRNLRLIVVDEEHDASYKQEEGVIYHARDMAVARAKAEKIPAVLVSATPSLETYYNVSRGIYRAVHLRARHYGASLPVVEMIDMRASPPERGTFLSEPLKRALAETLAAGRQSLLFLNRRGYAPLTLCRACGHRFQCPQCTAWLVMHRKGMRDEGLGAREENLFPNPQSPIPNAFLQCHHCNYRIPMPGVCPSCAVEGKLAAIGPGIERVQEEVEAFLPAARVAVLTSDTADTYDKIQARIQAMQGGGVDILIGTQMVAKGHHFGNLALVGVVDADLGLGGGDLRAGERTYQLLHQLSGRAGREKVAGRVLLQSFAPEHPVMKALIAGDRDAFMALELEERRRGRLPPFFRLAAIIIEGAREEQVTLYARALARAAPLTQDIEVLGPAPAPLYRLRGNFRQRLLVRAPRTANLQAWLEGWLAREKAPSSLRMKVDVDPYGFL